MDLFNEGSVINVVIDLLGSWEVHMKVEMPKENDEERTLIKM